MLRGFRPPLSGGTEGGKGWGEGLALRYARYSNLSCPQVIGGNKGIFTFSLVSRNYFYASVVNPPVPNPQSRLLPKSV